MSTIKYPSIEQFKNLIRKVKDRVNYRGKDENGNPIYVDSVLPVITFTGTVKIHGTNAGIRFDGVDMVAQSRERDLSLISDNCGFYAFVFKNEAFFKEILGKIKGNNQTVVMYGEWFGKGVQKGVAVSEVEKKFAIFGVRFVNGDVETWVDGNQLHELISGVVPLDELNNNSVYVVSQFPSFEIDIDFNDPAAVQNKLVQFTDVVEAECPVGRYFFCDMKGASVTLVEGKVVSDKELTQEVSTKCKEVLTSLPVGTSIIINF